MKKTMLKSGLLAIAGIALVAGAAAADPFNNGPSLIQTPEQMTSGQTALEDIVAETLTTGGVNVYTDQTGVGGWTESESDVATYLVNLGMAAGIGTPHDVIFGVYDLNGANQVALLNTSDNQVGASFSIYNGSLIVNNNYNGATSGWSDAFGFYLTDLETGDTVYTEDSKNNGDNHSATYLLGEGTQWDTGFDSGTFTGNNDWLLAFDFNEDLGPNSARDFNDGVFIIEDMNAVPEPATMMLFGAGLAGLAGLGRRRK